MIGQATRASVYVRLRVLVYSSDARTRHRVKQALGRSPDPDGPSLEFVEAATQPTVVQEMASGTIDLAILDGESSPAGGLGVAKQLKDELLQCPPIVMLTGRSDDAWLATWSRADAVVPHPVDPVVLSRTVVSLLRSRLM